MKLAQSVFSFWKNHYGWPNIKSLNVFEERDFLELTERFIVVPSDPIREMIEKGQF